VTKKGVILAVATAVTLLVVVISFTFWLLKQSFPGVEDVEPNVGETPLAEEAAPVVGEDSTLEDVETEGRIQVVVQQLLAGSQRGRGSPFPRGVQLRGLFITPQGLAFVDLSQELISNHPGGTCAEELTIYSLSNTLITNFPAVKGVQILVEGREVQSLAGHLDLSKPYGRGPQRLEPS
jgi:hypothetical protein